MPSPGQQPLGTGEDVAEGVLDHPGANRAVASLKADTTAFEEVGDSGEGFAAVPAVAAYCEDEVTERIIAVGYFEGLFHMELWLVNLD